MNIKKMKNKKLLKLSMAFAALSVVAMARADVDWTQFDRSFSVKLTGYRGSSTLENFPVLIKLSKSLNGFDYSKCKISNGGDLRFSDAEGNLLDSEVDTWDNGGTSLVWVRVPSLSKNTTISVYYGCDNPVVVDGSNVWWRSGYVGVWHMNGSGLPLAESSGVSTPIDQGNANVVYGYAGAVGGAVDMSGVTTGWAHQLSAADDDDLDGFTNFTFEIWTRQEAWGASSTLLLSKRSSAECSYHWYCAMIPNQSGYRAANIMLSTNGSATLDNNGNRSCPELGEWTHQAIVRNTAQNYLKAFVNGENSHTWPDSCGSDPIWNSAERLDFGSGQRGYPIPGQIDEVRISNVARSDDWIQATKDCVLNDDFATLVVENDWAAYKHKFLVSFPNYEGEALENIPVLVRISESSINGFRYGDCLKQDGKDLRFAASDGTLLVSEVDTWNTNGVSLVWVKVPTLNSDTQITAYYGRQYVPYVDPKAVWANGYVGVWHMNENQLPLAESSGISTPIDQGNANVVYGYAGAVGGAVDMSGVTSGWAHHLSAADDDDLDGFTNFTFEMWTRQEAWGSSSTLLLSKRSSAECSYHWYCAMIPNQSGYRAANIILSTDGSTTSNFTGNVACPELGEWTHQAIVRNTAQNQLKSFVNGENSHTWSDSCGSDPIWNSAERLDFGSGQRGYPIPGQIDEVRISNVARSDDWIQATHDMVQKSDFATYGEARENVRGLSIFVR